MPQCASAGAWGLTAPLNPMELASQRPESRSPFIDLFADSQRLPQLKPCFKNDLCRGIKQRLYYLFSFG